MIQHYLKMTLRGFRKHLTSFLINVIGLATGLGAALLIYIWIQDELHVDQFHSQQLYQVMEHQHYSNGIGTTTSTPGILGEYLQKDFPEVKYGCETTWNVRSQLKYEDKLFKKEGIYAGSHFFELFSFPLLAGSPVTVLETNTSIALSESLAQSLFGSTEAAMGKAVLFDNDAQYQVSAVFQDPPARSSMKFDFVLPWKIFEDENDWVKEWGNNGPRCNVLLNDGVDVAALNVKLMDYIKEKDEGSTVDLFVVPYGQRYLHGRYEDGVQVGGRIDYVRLFGIVALFILIIACINFMNLATARASQRAHEVGVRKAIGAERRSLIIQYLSESMGISLIALILAWALAWLALPVFNSITSKSMALTFDERTIAGSLVILLFTGLVSGSYPALYLSSFNPVRVLKGKIKSSWGEVFARKGLVIFQFVLSIVLIIAVLIVRQQIDYVQTKNLGYNKDQLIHFEAEGEVNKKKDVFLDRVRQLPGVVAASSVGHSFLGQNNNTYGIDWPGKEEGTRILFENFTSDYGLLSTMGIQLKDGRDFSRDFGADSSKIIVNEKAVEIMHLDHPVGTVIKQWGKEKEIIGVVKDFHFQSLHEEMRPAFFWLSPDNAWNIVIRLEPTMVKAGIQKIEGLYESFNPGFIFEYTFQDEDYADMYQAEQRVASLAKYFAGIAIVISCLGLFGLAAFTADRRTKEIGVRKILGAGSWNIIWLISRDFTRLVIVAIVIAVPVAWYLTRRWLSDYAFAVHPSIWVFLGAALAALTIAWLTVSTHAYRATQVHPADCLQDE
ncbi:MAG: ABC transporter permease [Saprospiraceae bacterium]|nr:ABC transporter permease [Saprospiraceae bacterium]MCB9318076.1 ABC transporter permease [Lewinellaceae bacterium]